jgi:hypothetical protein
MRINEATERTTAYNTGLAKVAVQCSADTFVVNQSLVLRINICGENRHLRQARKRNTKAQVNLVPDGSFEDTTNTYPILPSGEGSLIHWHSPSNEMYITWWNLMSINRFWDINQLGLPLNQRLYQYPKYGYNSIALVVLNKEPLPHTNLIERSVIRSKLNSKLIAGKQYCATIYVNAWDYDNNYWTNGIGLYFDNGQLDTMITVHHDSSGYFPGAVPQVQCNFLINDTANWMKVQGSFIANGTEEHLTITNFQKDSNTWAVPNGYNTMSNGQDISIDNVSLIPIDINNWLPSITYSAFGADSTWVGLNKFDYADGKWYTGNMQYITTGPGFWLYGKNIENGKQYIHEIDICGVMKYDTTTIQIAPLSNVQLSMNNLQLKVWPNPATNVVTISVNTLINQPVYISNTSGQIVYQQNLHQPTTTIDISQWASGVYFVRYAGVAKKLVVQ